MSLPGLWVDDDEQFLQDNIPLLERRGLRIDRAHSGMEALSILEGNPRGYSYLIVDLDMPVMNGVELIRRVRAIHPTISIMLASAHVDEPVWMARLETLAESLPSIPKVFPMITSPKFDEIVEKIQQLGHGDESNNTSALKDLRRKNSEATPTEIPALYSAIRELVSRSNSEPELRSEIDRGIELLRRLQEMEADELEFSFEERFHLKSGSGWTFLKRMKERLGEELAGNA